MKEAGDFVSLGFSYANERRGKGTKEFWSDFLVYCKKHDIEDGDPKDLLYMVCKHFQGVDNELAEADCFMDMFQNEPERKRLAEKTG